MNDYYYVLCLSVTKLFPVLFKYCIVIIMKVEMLYVVLNNSMLNKRHGYINNNNNRPNNNNGTYIALLK